MCANLVRTCVHTHALRTNGGWLHTNKLRVVKLVIYLKCYALMSRVRVSFLHVTYHGPPLPNGFKTSFEGYIITSCEHYHMHVESKYNRHVLFSRYIK